MNTFEITLSDDAHKVIMIIQENINRTEVLLAENKSMLTDLFNKYSTTAKSSSSGKGASN